MQYNDNMENIYQTKGESLAEQFRDAGRLFAIKIQASVRKIGRKRSRLINIRREVAERTWNHLQNVTEAKEFCECLRAWSEGAGVNPEQAMWCIADNLSGCQTLMARYQSGVVLLHSEEEFRDNPNMELHMTKPHTMEFRVGGETLKTLVYNDLLPGAGLYGWKDDMMVAVDSLFLREDGIESVESPLLANVVSWLVWRMHPSEAEASRIAGLAGSLGELVDGYVLNVVRRIEGKVEGYKLTLARSEHRVEYLGGKPGDYLRQVNIVDPRYPKMNWALPPKNIWRGGYKYFTRRLQTMDTHMAQYGHLCNQSLSLDIVAKTHELIQEILYSDLRESYVNIDMGAMCVGMLDLRLRTSVSCRLNDGKIPGVIEYLDRSIE